MAVESNAPSKKRVVIAGGGTAGWIAAAALSSQLGPLIDVTLVESDDIGTIGVGEATIPTHRTFHRLLGIDERAFMRDTQATFKLGISFENWRREGESYIHSFGTVGKSSWLGDFQHFWLAAKRRGLAGELGEYCLEYEAAKAGRFAAGGEPALSYAYHLDASLYAKMLRRASEAKGVRRIEGRIASIDQDPESGDIEALLLEDGQRIEGDLFIDCTGFRALLIEGVMEAGFEDWSHLLPTDRAIAVQTEATGPALPYTRAVAHGNGWRWRIPLQTRIGNGFVYSSQYLDDDEAEAQFISMLDGAPLTEPRRIRCRTGKRKKAWVGNCVALGLSSGFVEPLESTSIHLIQVMATRLLQLFPFAEENRPLADRFNALFDAELDHIRDFIVLHYKVTERDDTPFWRDRRALDVPPSLERRIDAFERAAMAYQDAHEIFRVDSWVQVMIGQGLMPRGYHRMGDAMPDDRLRAALTSLRSGIQAAVDRLPAHQDFIEQYCPAALPR